MGDTARALPPQRLSLPRDRLLHWSQLWDTKEFYLADSKYASLYLPLSSFSWTQRENHSYFSSASLYQYWEGPRCGPPVCIYSSGLVIQLFLLFPRWYSCQTLQWLFSLGQKSESWTMALPLAMMLHDPCVLWPGQRANLGDRQGRSPEWMH